MDQSGAGPVNTNRKLAFNGSRVEQFLLRPPSRHQTCRFPACPSSWFLLNWTSQSLMAHSIDFSNLVHVNSKNIVSACVVLTQVYCVFLSRNGRLEFVTLIEMLQCENRPTQCVVASSPASQRELPLGSRSVGWLHVLPVRLGLLFLSFIKFWTGWIYSWILN